MPGHAAVQRRNQCLLLRPAMEADNPPSWGDGLYRTNPYHLFLLELGIVYCWVVGLSGYTTVTLLVKRC